MRKPEIIAVGNRIKTIRTTLEMSQKDFSISCGMSPNYLSEIETGKFKPGYDFLKNLVKKFNVDFNYLVLGQGDMFRNTREKEPEPPKETNPGNEMGTEPEPDTEPPGDARTPAADYGPRDNDVERMLWYFKHAPVVKYAVMEYFKKYIFQNKEMIEEELAEEIAPQ